MPLAASPYRPPVTRLRPLHTHNEVDQVSSSAQSTWTSSFKSRPSENTVLKGFVRLVAQIVILGPGDAFCIHDSIRGGYIESRVTDRSHQDGSFTFIPHEVGPKDIPTDFSIGPGKGLQLHLESDSQVRLRASVNIAPKPALCALGQTLEDIITSLEGSGSEGCPQWTKPSVLNWPPRDRPMPLWPGEHPTTDPALLHRWFERGARDFPQRIALDFLEDIETGQRTQYTYLQVSNAATALGARLSGLSTVSKAPVRTVAVLMGPCPGLYISYIAALKAGLAFCPIPVDAPEERRDILLEDLKPVAVLVAEESYKLKHMKIMSVAEYLDLRNVEPQPQPSLPSVTETDAAYILYTSGTTGVPKGVIVSHISAACTVSALSNHYGFPSPETPIPDRPVRWFQGAAPTFDISLFEIFWTLSTGSTLCCAPRALTMQNVDKVLTMLQADITNVTPSFASLIDPSSIRSVMVGGETLNSRLLQDFARYNPSPKDRLSLPQGIYNGYGPTEVTIYSVAQAHVPKNQRGSVIGVPLVTCGALIVDERARGLAPVAMGATGELVLTGEQVSKIGYLNRHEETAKAFVDDAKWGRAYRTGDRARIVWDQYGERQIEFLGRISEGQVKLSGRRVELGEIESVLASKAEGARQALACVWKSHQGALGSERVVGLVVSDPKSRLGFEVVQTHCMEVARRHLPDYMRPVHILQVEELPRSDSGKVDRKAATEYVRTALQQSRQNPAQVSEAEVSQSCEDANLEAELVKILSSIVNDTSTPGPSLTATSLLSEAGVDSLQAMRFLRDIRNRWPDSKHLQPSLGLLLGSKANIRSIFSASTSCDGGQIPKPVMDGDKAIGQQRVADFASRHKNESIAKLGSINDIDIEAFLPATSTQSQLAVSFAMDSRNYISHSVLKLRADVSIAALESAIHSIINRQAVYRCAMVSVEDDLSPFAQIVLKPDAWRRWVGNDSRVVYRTGNVAGDAQEWHELANQHLDFDTQRLYHVQLIQTGATSESHGNESGLLVISLAHCLCDGASVELLLSDISREYAGLYPLDRLGIEDVVLDWASNVNTEIDKKWQGTLKDWEVESFRALSGNNISTPSPAGIPIDYRPGMVHIDSDLQWQTLEAKSRTLGASPLAVLQASWAMLLQIFSEANTGDVVFGSVISGQHEAAHAPTFSVVPCRVTLPACQTVHELLLSLVSGSRYAQCHRNLSFGIFETLPYNTALALQAYSPPGLARSEEGVTGLPWTEVRNPAVRYDFDIFAEVFPNGCASLSDVQRSTMSFRLTYRGDSLSEISASVIGKQFASLIEVLLSCKTSDLVQTLPARLPRDLLSAEGTIPPPTEDPAEKQRQLQDRVEILHAQFENQAVETPDLLALRFYTSVDDLPVTMTYAELDARANGLANILREDDVEVIPICMQRSVELYVSILAILKAGSAWSPIDETSPIQRRTSLIARTQGRVLLTTTDSLHLVEPCLADESLSGMRVILVDQYAKSKTSVRAKPRRSILASSTAIDGRALAYLLWTSGTTGEPKGVMIHHHAAASAMRALQIQVEHDKDRGQVRTLQLSSYSFDVFVQDLFFTWGLAGSVISGTRELVLGSFADFVNKSRPTHAHLTPSFGASINVEEIKGSTLQFVTFIGEKLTEDVAEAWAAPEITTKVYNTYGPAENAVVSTMRQFYGKSRDQAKAANVGFPLAECTAYVVRSVDDKRDGGKENWELVPRYGVGELALGGSQVGMGYLNNEAKTSKTFIQGGPGINERIYLTGDIVRLNDHGFEFLGRTDDLVKIAGIRIELSEISAACAIVKDDELGVEHIETLFLPRPGADGGDANNKVVVTFVSSKKENVDPAYIRKQVFLRAREMLPAYMVPGHVVVLDSTMPRTASNKVDRKALQFVYNDADLTVLAGRDVAASCSADVKVEWLIDQLEVVKAIAENLQMPMEPLSPDDSLASLGFSSLQVVKLAWELRRRMQCTTSVLDLMRCQTLGELVEIILASVNKMEGASSTNNTVSQISWVALLKEKLTESLRGDLRPENTSHVLPTTPVQESLLIETMIDLGAYWSHRIFYLDHLGHVDTARLKAAWTTAAAQLDILRTTFVPLSQLSVHGQNTSGSNSIQWAREQGVSATILQLVLDKPKVHWMTVAADDKEGLSVIADKIQVELAPLGNMAPQPPWAITFSENSNMMMLSMHHALHDEKASSMLLERVANLYRNLSYPPEDASDTVSQMSRGMELGLLPSISQRNEAVSAWSKRLHDLVEVDGPLNSPFPDLTGSRQEQKNTMLSLRRTIPDTLLERLPGAPNLPRLIQSAFGCILAAILELKTVVFGQTVSQRILHPDLARVVGPAMATLPVIVRAHASSADELWADMVRDASLLSHSAHRLHPADIKKIVNEGMGHSQAPLAALFVYHPAAAEEEETFCAGHEFFRESGRALSLNVEHAMALNVFEADNVIELTGNARSISQPMLELMLGQIFDQAYAMLQHPKLPLDQLNNLLNRDFTAIIGESKTLVGTDIATNPADLVAKQASEHPDWIAVEEIFLEDDDDDSDKITTKTVTYHELDVLVNAIASKLVDHQTNLQPGDVVALYLGRDTKSLAAIIAIFKCGYVYLPIDGDLPTARKQLLVRDANAKLVLTTEGLVEDLSLDPANDPATILLPEGNDELDIIKAWPNTISGRTVKPGAGDGGYLLYTSGSTGRPKGVRVTNEGLLHFISAMTKRLIKANADTGNLGGIGKYLNVASRAFDTHLTSMFAPWHLGFRSAIGKDRNGIFASLQQVINEVKITHMGSVPSVLMQLGIRLVDVPSIRVLTFGGEKASHELFEQLNTGNPKAALMNFYGPTEATIGCLSHIIGPHSNSRNLGKPLHGLEAILLVPRDDAPEQVVARKGQPGEFCIAGPQVAVGYLNRPEENAKGFQYTKLLGGGQKLIYRTGDIMRMMHDGTFEFLGRKDQQTKIRGQRFEISEVESFIKKTVAEQGPLDVAATVVDQRLMGLLARKKTSLLQAEIDAEPELLSQQSQSLQSLLPVIERACREALPAFMVPEMMWVSKIPYLTASGKVDSKSLIKLAKDFIKLQQASSPHSDTAGAVPLDPTETKVVASIQEAIGNNNTTRTVTSASTIHGLGIDSLSGVHLLSVLKRYGFIKVTLGDLLSPSCTVGSLAQIGDADLAINESAAVKKLTWSLDDIGLNNNSFNRADVDAVLPCLPLQSSLVAMSLNWLGSLQDGAGLEAGNDVPYVTQFNYELAPGTYVTEWKKVATQLFSSEAILRTCFIQREQDGQIFQVVLKAPSSPFEGDDNAASIVAQMSYRPPVRLSIMEDQVANKAIVSLRIHHALYDGAAIAALRNKMEQAYRRSSQAVDFNSNTLSTLQIVASYCHLNDEDIRFVRSSWQAKLRGIQPCRVGADTGDGNTNSTMVRVTKRLSYTTSELKIKLQQKSPVSPSTAFQVAMALCLAQLTKGPSIVYGFTMSLRPHLNHLAQDIDDFVGPCLNTLIHAIKLDGASETLPHLAKRIHEAHADACQGKMPLVTANKVQRWAGLQEKLFDSLLTINVVPEYGQPTSRTPEPGHMTPLPGKSQGDLALAIDIDMHANGGISVLLSSAGVLTVSQLESVGALFEKVVVSSADSTATVEQFVSMTYETDRTASNGLLSIPSRPAGDDYDASLASVQSVLCDLLRLDEGDIEAFDPNTISLYQLGLDSINVLPFVKRINKIVGVKIAPNAVLRARTLQGVATLVHQATINLEIPTSNSDNMKVTNTDREPGQHDNLASSQNRYEQIQRQIADDILFIATPLQQGMLSASLAIKDQAYMYTHSMQLSIAAREQDSPSFEHFFAAVEDTVQACEILRSRFVFTQNDDVPWVGIISPTEQSDLVDWCVTKLGVVRLKIHHALYDARSIQTVWRLLKEHYANRLAGYGERPDIHSDGSKYLFRAFARESALAQRDAVAFWTESVRDYVYEPIPVSDESMHASALFHFTLNDTELYNLQNNCKAANATLKASLQLAWAKVLCEKLYKRADVVFGEVITASSDDNSDVVMGPTINTIPIRIKLASQSGATSIHEGLACLQVLGDYARGTNGMASLRSIQSAWRSSMADGVNTAAGLFQSLFVFDGVIDSNQDATANDLLQPAKSQVLDNTTSVESSAAYDDYPFIVSFRIKDGLLHGALRAKISQQQAESIGSHLVSALQYIATTALQNSTLDPAHTQRLDVIQIPESTSVTDKRAAQFGTLELNGLTPKAEAVLEIVKKVVGGKIRKTDIAYSTKLVNIGVDSISAIRLSKVLRQQLGIHASVFEIIRGASIQDVIKKSAAPAKTNGFKQATKQTPSQKSHLRQLVADELGLSEGQIESVSPVLSGQRGTLQQWLRNGKRFFEAPWVYRVNDEAIDSQKVKGYWQSLCQVHEILRTTFVYLAGTWELLQVTLDESVCDSSRFTTVQDTTLSIHELLQNYVSDGNAKPSDFKEPPARFAFLDAADGKGVVLRVHHALYDAWSIKMIQRDLARLFSTESLQSRPSVLSSIQEINDFRQPEAEQEYWKRHLLKAQDTIFQYGNMILNEKNAPPGPQFKINRAHIIPQDDVDVTNDVSNNKAHSSAAIIGAYARTIGQLTGSLRPTFGLNHSSRSLSSVDGESTLDLTSMSVPTMAVVPISVNLEKRSNQKLLAAVQDHLAQLAKFAQVENLENLSPKFNSHVNILYSEVDIEAQSDCVDQGQVLQHHKLREPLASAYFTNSQPSAIVSTIDDLDTSSIPEHQVYFNVLVHQNGNISVSVSGDKNLLQGDQGFVTKLVDDFVVELVNLIKSC